MTVQNNKRLIAVAGGNIHVQSGLYIFNDLPYVLTQIFGYEQAIGMNFRSLKDMMEAMIVKHSAEIEYGSKKVELVQSGVAIYTIAPIVYDLSAQLDKVLSQPESKVATVNLAFNNAAVLVEIPLSDLKV